MKQGKLKLEYQSLCNRMYLERLGFAIMRLFLKKKPVTRDCKLIILVRADLNMSKGKIATSCSHAAVECYRRTTLFYPQLAEYWMKEGHPSDIYKWNSGGEKLRELIESAREKNLICTPIRDAGRTEVAPGTFTALGIGPDSQMVIESILPHLQQL